MIAPPLRWRRACRAPSSAWRARHAGARGGTGSTRAGRRGRWRSRSGIKPEMLARVLAGRDVELDEVQDFLDPTIRKLMPDPHTVTAMEAAAKRIADAAVRREQVAIFGDYDVDGATSAALLAWHLRHCGLDPLIHIPDRIFEGYGPNVEAIRTLAGKGATLLVTVDCGTTSLEPLAEARRLGMSVVVIDHHQSGDELPEVDALVNPNRPDDLSGLGHLAAVGLVLVTLVAVNRELRGAGVLEPVKCRSRTCSACCILWRSAPSPTSRRLTGLNRAFVAKGLIAMRRREHVGLTALMDVSRLNGPPEAWHLGFMLGPRINAGGRIGRADLGVRLLLEGDVSEAARIAAELDRLNTRAPRHRAGGGGAGRGRGAGVARAGGQGRGHRHRRRRLAPGVVGLVASRLKERFARPAFAIALEPGGIGTGSGRSISGRRSRQGRAAGGGEGLLMKGGGHAMAAGVTLARTGWRAIRAYLEHALGPAVTAARRNDSLLIDGALAAGATVETAAQIMSRRAVRRRQCGTGRRAARAHHRLCRGSWGACKGAAALARRHDATGHRLQGRRQAARPKPHRAARPPHACGGNLCVDRGRASTASNCASATQRRRVERSAEEALGAAA